MTTAAHLATTEPTGWAELKQRIRALGGRRTVRDRPPRGRFPWCEPQAADDAERSARIQLRRADLREQLAAIYRGYERAEYLVVLGRKEQDNGIL